MERLDKHEARLAAMSERLDGLIGRIRALEADGAKNVDVLEMRGEQQKVMKVVHSYQERIQNLEEFPSYDLKVRVEALEAVPSLRDHSFKLHEIESRVEATESRINSIEKVEAEKRVQAIEDRWVLRGIERMSEAESRIAVLQDQVIDILQGKVPNRVDGLPDTLLQLRGRLQVVENDLKTLDRINPEWIKRLESQIESLVSRSVNALHPPGSCIPQHIPGCEWSKRDGQRCAPGCPVLTPPRQHPEEDYHNLKDESEVCWTCGVRSPHGHDGRSGDGTRIMSEYSHEAFLIAVSEIFTDFCRVWGAKLHGKVTLVHPAHPTAVLEFDGQQNRVRQVQEAKS